MSGSSSERWRLDPDPAVIMVEHGLHTVDDLGNDECNECGHLWPCQTYQLAKAWAEEFRQHTEALVLHNALGCDYGYLMEAYAALEQQYLAVSEAHAALVDKISGLAAEAVQ